MTVRERLLSAAITAARPLLPVTVLFAPRVARAAAERRGVARRLEDWAEARRDPERPLLWLHGASAGELVGAASVVEELRRRAPVQLVVSYFSPSAEPVLPRLSPDAAEPLPLDVLSECRRALQAVAPDAIVFARGDVWPNFTRAAERLGVPLGMVNGVVAEESSRLGASARWLTEPAYGRLRRVAAVSEADAGRLRRLGVADGAIRVTGDAALDSAAARLERAGGPERGGPADRLRRLVPAEATVLIGGSTWREDEAVLLEAVAAVRRAGEGPVALVLVPHEPDAEALAAIGSRCRERLGVEPRRWSEAEPGEGGAGGVTGDPTGGGIVPPLVVDEVGVLAELYAAADVAWVGGGLGADGLHSVVEPAAAGLPVLFGDRSGRPEADALVREGGGLALSADRAAGVVASLSTEPERREAMAEAARAYVEAGSGAAARAADLVEELLFPAGGGEGRP